jgi:hypothetical protein
VAAIESESKTALILSRLLKEEAELSSVRVEEELKCNESKNNFIEINVEQIDLTLYDEFVIERFAK